MKKYRIKKIFTAIIVWCLCFSFTTPYLAATEDKSIETCAKKLQNMFPEAEITVKDGTINIVTDDDTLSSAINGKARATGESIYSPNGGSYRDFKKPWYAYFQAGQEPYSKVYLPAEKTTALLKAVVIDGLLSDVLSWVGKKSVDKIATLIAAKYAVYLTNAQILFLMVYVPYTVLNWIDTACLVSAIGDNGKISITRLTYEGCPVNIYSEWNGNNVTISPYTDWEPEYYAGEYDI